MLSAAETTQAPTAIIKEGRGIWGRPTAGCNVIRQAWGEAGYAVEVKTDQFEQFRRTK